MDTTDDLLTFHDSCCSAAYALMAQKNHDYAGADRRTPFANFELAEKLGLCSTAAGVLVRLSDKIARLAKFEQSGEMKVTDESVLDTVRDIINYAVIYGALRTDASSHVPVPVKASIDHTSIPTTKY